MGPSWFGAGGFGVMAVLFGLINLVFWIAVIAAVVLGIRWLIRQNAADTSQKASPGEDAALQLLRQRYARGEIDATEFEERKRTLGG